MEHSALFGTTAFPPLAENAIVLTGPTASGKSSVAISIAEHINAEIVSIDSIAVYQGMDIGTAKPSATDRVRVPHHLLDVVSPTEEFSVANYLTRATHCSNEIIARGKRPLFVGGTPMYLKGLLYGFDPGPPADWEFRRAVEADIAAYGIEALHKRLQQVDPLSAHKLPATDTRRITRALEVAYLTGVPISHRQTQHEHLNANRTPTLIALSWPRETLHQRIQQRVESMFQVGLVGEVQSLLDQHQALSRTAATAVGYREVIAHLCNDIPINETKQRVLFHTRQLARRQETWFRSLPTLQSIEVTSEQSLVTATEQIVKQVSQ